MPTIKGARERARAEITTEITAEARRQLAVEGPTGLSLRAVARELGMVSSGIYRYVASRDELLTMLIIEAYDALGATVERTVAASTGSRRGTGSSRRRRRPAVGAGQPARVRPRLRFARPGLRGARRHHRSGLTGDPGARRRRRRRPPGRFDRPLADHARAVPDALRADLDRARAALDVDSPTTCSCGCWRRGPSCSASSASSCSARRPTWSRPTTPSSTPRRPPWPG